MKKFFPFLLFLGSFTLLGMYSFEYGMATCNGATPCKACKNCKYCKYCSKNKGKCGVCK